MDPFPHHYRVSATGGPQGAISHGGDLPPLLGNAPAQFGGPGDQWSPEELLAAAVADCFILTFRAVAAASGLTWTSLSCRAEGLLERIDRVTRFTRFDVHVELEVLEGSDPERVARLLEKSEAGCIITNSMNAQVILHPTVTYAAAG